MPTPQNPVHSAAVMVVEDDISCRSFIQDLLETAGYRILACEGPAEALQVLRHVVVRPELFIVDFNMQTMNGYEFIQELKRREDVRGIPILMLTATQKKIQELVEMQGVSYLPKSSSNQAILETVHRLLGSRPAAAEATFAPAPREERPVEVTRDYFPPPQASVQEFSAPLPPIASAAPEVQEAPPVPETEPARASTSPPLPPTLHTVSVAVRDAWLRQMMTRLASPSAAPAQAPLSLEEAVRPPASREAQPSAAPAPASAELHVSKGLRAAEEVPGESPIIKMVEDILSESVQRRASDIHMEPHEDALAVRVRVDGTLHPLTRIPLASEPMVSARVKILAGMDITEKRLPQDGHFSRVDAEGRMVEFRVSTLPSLHGEKIVLRVLQTGNARLKLEALGLSQRNAAALSAALKASNGLILVTGPTGSGKTSMLYSMLEALNNPGRNIITVEDPVEYRLKGVTQVEVHAQIGYTFERVLRHLLRQDPNIIMIGEIRDAETASIALKAAATGHMVLSSLHTNDAPSTLHRLVSMGIPPYLVAAGCRLIVAQRLLRQLCPDCSREDSLRPEEAAQLTAEEARSFNKVWRAVGCAKCKSIGYRGRVPIFEMMPVVSHEMKQAVLEHASPETIGALAAKEGMQSLRREALALAAAGLTSPEEAFSVLFRA